VVVSKELKNLENSSVELTVTVEKEALAAAYKTLLANYAKKAQIKGFRPGKVPASVLETKFGESIRAEAAMEVTEKSLQEIFETIEVKPLPFLPPALTKEMTFDGEPTYTVVYDTYPVFEAPDLTAIEVEEPQVTIGKSDEEAELKLIQDQNSIVIEKDDAVCAKDHIVTINYEELDEAGESLPGSLREDFVFTVGTGYNFYKIDDEIIGMKKDETRVVTKEYPADFEIPELAGKKKQIRVTLTKIKIKQLPELNDELAQDVSEKYSTLADLKADIKKKLTDSSKARVRETMLNSALDAIADASTIDLPRSMVAVELDSSWKNFVARFRTTEANILALLERDGKTKDGLLEEWKPSIEKNLKSRLVMDKVIEAQKIEVTDADVEAELVKQAEASGTNLDELKERYTKGNMMEYVRHDILDTKVFDYILSVVKVKKGKKIAYGEFMKDAEA